MDRRKEGREAWNRLLEWEKGQTDSERLSASILSSEGFSSVDPSHPLGGPDGLKDIICLKDGIKWIAGVYFHRGKARFPAIEKKFKHDIEGVASNKVQGFIFVTNQELRLAERGKLEKVAGTIRCELFHLERIASILNNPKNYGVRLEFLDIEMTKEEQLAYFAEVTKSLKEMPRVVQLLDTLIENREKLPPLNVPISELTQFRTILSYLTQAQVVRTSGRFEVASPIDRISKSVPVKDLEKFKSLIDDLTQKQFVRIGFSLKSASKVDQVRELIAEVNNLFLKLPLLSQQLAGYEVQLNRIIEKQRYLK